jgi:hypothetical protein
LTAAVVLASERELWVYHATKIDLKKKENDILIECGSRDVKLDVFQIFLVLIKT